MLTLLLLLALSPFALGAPISNTGEISFTPALAENFPDPCLVSTGGWWFAFATSDKGRNIQVATSPSFMSHSWSLLQDIDVLPDPGSWAKNEQHIWAPDVFQLSDGRWVMYYAAPTNETNSTYCVGAAISTNILGPYDPTDSPLSCPRQQGGAIDPSAFLDPKTGKLYIVYKIDGNSLNTGGGPCNGGGSSENFHATPIMLQEVDTDGITLIGEPIQLLDRDDSDGPLVEAPSMFYNHDSDTYFMTFSSNCYSTDLYDIGFAYSSNLTSGFTKSKTPLMATQAGLIDAPGGADMTPDGRFAVYHATVSHLDNGEPIRYMYSAFSTQKEDTMSAWPI